MSCERSEYASRRIKGAPDAIKYRASYRSTQSATILLSAKAANKLLNVGELRIGSVNCRVRLFAVRCYRCSETGHLAKNCKSTVDCLRQCFRCRKEDHKAIDCAVGKDLTVPVTLQKENG